MLLMVEVYLLLFSVYVLVIGLFVSRLTSLWLWSSFGLSLASFCYFFSGFKNFSPFDFFYGVNLGVVFLWLCLLLLWLGVGLQRSTIGRDLIGWLLLVVLAGVGQSFFAGGYSCFQINLAETFWSGTLQGGSFYHDIKLLVLVVCLLTFVGVYHRGCHQYEFDYAVLILLGGLASLLLITQDNLMMLYLNLEFQALILYVLTTYYRFEESNSEAGLKYLLVGSLVSGFFLVGVFVFYFYNGSLNLTELSFVQGQTWLMANFIFKLGAAPFYFWTPSVYQQMDYPSLIFVGAIPKLSVWFLIFKNFSFLTVETSLLYWSGVLSVVVGAVGGLYQLSITSLVAYSGVLNTGYLLLFTDQAHLPSIIFLVSLYLVSYYLTLSVVLSGFSFFRSNFITEFTSLALIGGGFSLVVYYFFLSLGGLPVLPGFSAKVYLLGFALERNFFESFFIVFFSLFAVVYYLRVSGFFLFHHPQPTRSIYKVNFLYYLFFIVFFNSVGQSLISFW